MTPLVIVGGIAVLLVLWIAYYMRQRGQSAIPKSGPRTISRAPLESHPAPPEAQVWGILVSARNKQRVCPGAQEILDKQFEVGKEPRLPLASCPFPHDCTCHYVKLHERRKGERRSGGDRRQGLRFEQDQRRSGKDRRKKEGPDWDITV
jgi:hypothetical protein